MEKEKERPAKRPRTTNHVINGLKAVLHFKELELDKTGGGVPLATSRSDSEKLSAHADSAHNLYVSDTTRIVCFSLDGTFRTIVSNTDSHHIVPNGTVDYVVILKRNDKNKLFKVSLDGSVIPILESTTPLYGPDVCSNGDVVHHPLTSRLERRSNTGELIASIEGGRGRVIPFEANSYLTSGQDGHVYFASKTCIFRWNLVDRNVECIAGHPKAAGRRDGFSMDARFTHLKRPVLTRRFAYMRESDNRFCRLDLETFELISLQLRGVDTSVIETYGVTPDGAIMFLIFVTPFRIFVADIASDLESTFSADMARVDWTGNSGARFSVEFLAGKERKLYRVDGRILEARSAYFKSMLSGGMKETCIAEPIDLGDDVSDAGLKALFHFIHTDQFEPVAQPWREVEMDDEEVLRLVRLTLDVHALADRFLLPRLGRLSEVFLTDFALRPSIVLPILASITVPKRPQLANLESACWAFLEENWKEVIDSHNAMLQELVEQGHPLALELLRASSGLRRGAKRIDDDTPAA